MLFGIIGLIFLAVGWFAETVKIIKEKRSKVDLKFALSYTIGSLFLVAYSVQVNNLIFIILNSLVAVLSIISLVYSYEKTKK